MISRHNSLAGALALAATFPRIGGIAHAADAPKEFHIGYQKNGALLILKDEGKLATQLQSQGTAVKWIEFQSGPPMLEALNAGSIDFAATGDTPPIFAQAAGAKLVYVASVPVPGKSSGLLVRDASGITKIADLRGKKIAFAKGSSAHNFLVRVLEKANIPYSDITPVNLQPPDAAAAFQNGSVDAWSIWDPFYALGERFPGVHLLLNAEGVAPSNSFFLARQDFAASYPGTLQTVIGELARVSSWVEDHPNELAQELSKETGVDLAVERIAALRGNYRLKPLTPEVVKQQQGIADTFLKLGLIPRAIDIRAAVYTGKLRLS